ncbi:MAG: YgcG family protein [Salinivirgaceae bacterium]
MKKIFFTGLVVLFTFLNAIQANDIFTKPQEKQLVIDNAAVLAQSEEEALKQKLHQFSNETSTQVLIYTTNDLLGYDVADFAQRLGEGWGVGQKGFDNGIVIVFKPKDETPGRITLQTGYGIEPVIPDAIANRIIDIEMIPEFKNGNIYQGIDKAVDVCISLTKGEFTADGYKEQTASDDSIAGFIIVLIIFIFTFISAFGRAKKNKHYTTGSKSNLPLWTTLFLLGGSSGRSSGWGNFSGGSGSFGGGGSSFGGFGGGSFGGGGASGSW